MEGSTQAGEQMEFDSRTAKARLFGDERSDHLRKRLAKAQFMASLSVPTGGDETGDLSEAVTEPTGDDYPDEPIRIGRFTVLRKLGQGGMGVVYAAYDEELDRKVAIKILRGELSQDTRGRARILREAKALARLSHPNVVQVHEIGVWQEHDFVAMEFVAGQTLSHWVRAEERPWREVLRVMIEAGRGLAAAHEAGLVHRDFKPANILVGEDERPRVLDFGLARSADDGAGVPVSEWIQTGEHSVEESNESSLGELTRSGSAVFDQLLTATGAVLGTPAYMAPEQHLAQRATERSDQFSFCLVLYEALFGERPYKASSRTAYANKVIAGELMVPGPNSGVPAWLRQAICRGLAASPGERWPSMPALLAELGRDRARKWTRLVVAAGVIAGAGATLALAAGEPSAPLCAIDRSAVEASWNEDARAQLGQAFEATGLAASQVLFEQATQTFDSYADALVAGQRSACEARWVEHSQTDAQLELRMACLDQRERELRASVEALSEVETSTLSRSPSVLRELGEISMCEVLDELERNVPVPKDASTAEGIADAREDLARARASRVLGRLDDAKLIAADIRKRAELFDYKPLLGEVAYLEGQNALQAHELDEARGAVMQSIHVATVTDDARLGADAWLLLAKIYALGDTNPRDALRIAEAYVERLGDLPQHRFALRFAQGHILRTAGQYSASLAELDLAMALAEDGFPGSEWELALTHVARAATLSGSGKYPEARRDLEQAAEMQAGLGPDSPAILDAQFDLAVTEFENGELELAEPRLRQAMAGFERIYGPDYAYIGHGHLGLAQIALLRDDTELAGREVDLAIEVFEDDPEDRLRAYDAGAAVAKEREDFERALELLDLALSQFEGNPDAGMTQAYLHGRRGEILLASGQAEASLVECDRALEGFAAVDADVDAIDRVQVFMVRGIAYRDLGEFAHAREDLERAVELSPSDSGYALYAAEARVALAEVLVEIDEDLQAQHLADEALSLLQSMPEHVELAQRARALKVD